MLLQGLPTNTKPTDLVYYELHGDMYEAIKREKQLKKWQRVWKLELIENFNPGWKDLYEDII